MVFPKAIAILIPTLATVYCLPFAVSISMDPQTQNFEAGHFSSLALELGGNGLQWMLFGGSLACFIGLYDAEVMQGERTMMFFCESTLDGRPTLDLLGGQTKIPSGRISTWLFEGGDRDPGDVVERHGPIVRRVYVVANAVTVIALTLFIPYEALVEVEMLLLSLNVALFLTAFLWLRYTQPSLHRPYRIPGNFAHVAAMSIVPGLIIIVNLIVGVTDRDNGWEKSMTLLVIVALTAAAQLIAHLVCKCRGGRGASPALPMGAGPSLHVPSSPK